MRGSFRGWILGLVVLFLGFSVVRSLAQDDRVLKSGTVLLLQGDKLFVVDHVALKQTFYVDLDPEETSYVGDVVFSADRREIYFTVFGTGTSAEHGDILPRIVRLNVDSGTRETLLTDALISRISPLSPDSQHRVVTMVDFEDVARSYTCLFDTQTQTCTPLSNYLGGGQVIWVSADLFVGISATNAIAVYQLDGGNVRRRSISVGEGVFLSVCTVRAGEGELLCVVEKRDEAYRPRLVLVSIASGDVVELPYVLEDAEASCSAIALSPDGERIAFLSAQRLEVVDTSSGNVLGRVDDVDVLRFVWSPDSASVLAVLSIDTFAVSQQLGQITVADMEVSVFAGFTQEVYLLTAPCNCAHEAKFLW